MFTGPIDAWCRRAVHRRAHLGKGRQGVCPSGVFFRHRGRGDGGVPEDLGRDGVDPGNVDHRIGEAHIGLADVWGDVARCHRRHQHLGHANRERLHRVGDDRRTPGACGTEDPVQSALAVEPANDGRRPTSHRRHGSAAVACGDQGVDVGVRGPRHVASGEVDRVAGIAEDAGIDGRDVAAAPAHDVAEVGVLGAFGVECAEEDDGCHRHRCGAGRPQPAPSCPRPAPRTAPGSTRGGGLVARCHRGECRVSVSTSIVDNR
jgi:hypothetical protein